jgi:rod shape determining protein RodA
MIAPDLKPSRIDWITLALYYFLVIVGLLCVYASVFKETNPNIWDTSQNYGRQLIWIAISSFLGLMILLIDEKFFFAFAYPIYTISVLLLIAVLLAGTTVKGSSSWIEIGSFRMQPAEFAKFGTALALARFLSGYNVDFEKDKKIQWISAAIILAPMTIILFQNETGSTLVFTSFIFALLIQPLYIIIALVVLASLFLYFVRRTNQLIAITVGAIVLAGLMVSSIDYVFENVMQAHQRTRINVLLGKEVDIKGAGYNVQQSKIAIGSGGFWGKGFLQGTQNKFRFVPEQSTDFIFCTVGEEFGFMGSVLFVTVYIYLLYRLLMMAERQRHKFNRIYGYSVVSILFFHFLINVGMTLGIMPVIGIPLPFISYGGSALLSFTILLFIFIRLDANRVNELRNFS